MAARSPSSLVLRELTPNDAQAYYNVRLTALETCPEAFASSAEDWRGRSLEEVTKRLHDNYTSADQCMHGAFHDDTLVGMMGLFRETYPKLRHKAWVVAVYVEPQWRGQGIAGQLLDDLIRRAKKMAELEQLYLGVGTTNPDAMRLYESRGFKAFGIEEHAMLVNGQYVDEAHMQLFLYP